MVMHRAFLFILILNYCYYLKKAVLHITIKIE